MLWCVRADSRPAGHDPSGALVNLAVDPDRRAAMEAARVRAVEDFSLEAMVERMQAAYREVAP